MFYSNKAQYYYVIGLDFESVSYLSNYNVSYFNYFSQSDKYHKV